MVAGTRFSVGGGLASSGGPDTGRGGAMRQTRETIARCWECEAATDRPISVTLRVRAGRISTLLFCPRCYHACYRPLDPVASGTLDVETSAEYRRSG